jgi:uncharacterized delta-60 repeat protein
MVLERLNGNGSFDTSFGTNGIVTSSNNYYLIAVQSDGKIVVAGGTSGETVGGKLLGGFNLARYNSDGSLDTSFGKVHTSLPYYGAEPEALLLQANGDILIVGNTDDPYPPSDWLMARYTTKGRLDTSFGNNGIVTIQSSATGIYQAGIPNGAVLYPNAGTPNDGKIAVVGSNSSLSSGPVLVRFNTNGSLDTTFGSSGFVPLSVSPSGVAFDSSERFVIAGSSSNDTALERLNPDGTPDTTFGTGGVVTAGIPGTGAGGTPAIYPNTGTDTADYGKIVTGGSHVARFLPSTPASAPSFVVSGPASATAGVPFSVTVTATDANGNVLTNYMGTVDFASFDPQAALPPDYTFTSADQGVHTFTVTFYKATDQALFLADTGTPSVNGREVGLPVNPGAVAQFILEPSTTSVKSSMAFTMHSYAVDAYGNTTTFNGTVHFSSSDPNATLPSDETYPGNFGLLGTFILRTKGTQTITMTDVDDPSVFSTITIQVT